jgi:hypothetical protein
MGGARFDLLIHEFSKQSKQLWELFRNPSGPEAQAVREKAAASASAAKGAIHSEL